MPRPLSEQVVVVVGASSGIGRATALEFARRGARVVCAARTPDALDAVVREVEAAGGTAVALTVDIADHAQVQRLAGVAEQRFGRVDTWVNVAATAVYGRFEDIAPEEFARVLSVNLLGHVWGAYAAVPALRRAGGGVLVGVASVLGLRAVPLQTPYCTSKFGLVGFYDALRLDLRRERAPIAVTTVLPASIDTPLFARARSHLDPGERPQPVVPVYAPEVAARAIVAAAVRPPRQVIVGGAGVGVALTRLAPRLTDLVMTTGDLLGRLQRRQAPEDGRDAVDAPLPGPGAVAGDWPGRVFRHSLYTDVLRRPLVAGALAGVGGGLAVRRLARR